MIKTEFFTNKNGAILGFQIKGHSESAEFGNDIICAAVSSAAYMTANTITDVIGVCADVIVDEGEMSLTMTEKGALLCRDVMSGFKLHMVALEEQYPENINVNYTEV